jgi:hypothetical protein
MTRFMKGFIFATNLNLSMVYNHIKIATASQDQSMYIENVQCSN